MLAAGCGLTVLAGVAWTLAAPALRVRREIAPAKVARGEAAVGVVTVVNAGRRRAAVLAEDVCGDRSVGIEVAGLAPGGERTVSYRLPTERRGEIPVGPLRLVRADPLGMARRVQPCGGRTSLLVRPRVYPLPMLPVGRTRHLEGTTSDNAPSGTVTFHALREYAPGDDMRHIHWRSSARTGTLMTRELVDASRPRTTVVLDARPGVYGGAFELAVDAAASIAAAAGSRSHPVHVLTGAGPVLETRGGRGDAGALLDRLALLAPEPDRSPAGALDALRRTRAGGLLVLITGLAQRQEVGRLAVLRSRFDRLVVVRVGAGSEDQGGLPAGLPGVAWIDAGSPAELVAGWQQEAAR